MSLTIQIGAASVKRLSRELDRANREFQREQKGHMRKAANLLRRETRREMRGIGLVDTGRALKSIRANVYRDREDKTTLIAFVGATPKGRAFYWKFHELGVRKGAGRGRGSPGLPATPTALPALERNIRRVEAILAKSFRPLEGR